MIFFKKVINLIENIIFPPKCIVCDNNCLEILCSECTLNIEKMFTPVFVNVGIVKCASGFVYDGLIRNIICKFKFNNQKKLSKILSVYLHKSVNTVFNEKFDIISFVPSHIFSQNERGYNQSELLSFDLSKILNIPSEKCLKKIKKNKIQHGLSFEERQLNVKGVYKSISSFEGKKILLCDDIITTGATLSECVRILQDQGAEVYCTTIAHTSLKK